jgi:hypothetical protein
VCCGTALPFYLRDGQITATHFLHAQGNIPKQSGAYCQQKNQNSSTRGGNPIFFWNAQVVMLADFLPRGKVINAAC